MSDFNKKVAYMELSDIDPKTGKFLVDEKIAIICFASWCGACRMTKPEYAKIADTLLNKYNIRAAAIQFDVSDADEQKLADIVSNKYGISAFPTFLLIDEKGNLRDTVVGGGNANSLLQKLKF